MRSPQARFARSFKINCCSAVFFTSEQLGGFSVVNFAGLQYYFEDRFDLVRFVKVVRDAGLLLILRIGPFVAAEWNFGSASFVHNHDWLHYTVLVFLVFNTRIVDGVSEACRCGCITCQERFSVRTMNHSRCGRPMDFIEFLG